MYDQFFSQTYLWFINQYFNDRLLYSLCSDKTVEAKSQVDSAVGNECEKVELDNKCEKQLTMNKALGTK